MQHRALCFLGNWLWDASKWFNSNGGAVTWIVVSFVLGIWLSWSIMIPGSQEFRQPAAGTYNLQKVAVYKAIPGVSAEYTKIWFLDQYHMRQYFLVHGKVLSTELPLRSGLQKFLLAPPSETVEVGSAITIHVAPETVVSSSSLAGDFAFLTLMFSLLVLFAGVWIMGGLEKWLARILPREKFSYAA